jgi:hypothetical protein
MRANLENFPKLAPDVHGKRPPAIAKTSGNIEFQDVEQDQCADSDRRIPTAISRA